MISKTSSTAYLPLWFEYVLYCTVKNDCAFKTYLKGICEDLSPSLVGPFGKAHKELSAWKINKWIKKKNRMPVKLDKYPLNWTSIVCGWTRYRRNFMLQGKCGHKHRHISCTAWPSMKTKQVVSFTVDFSPFKTPTLKHHQFPQYRDELETFQVPHGARLSPFCFQRTMDGLN